MPRRHYVSPLFSGGLNDEGDWTETFGNTEDSGELGGNSSSPTLTVDNIVKPEIVELQLSESEVLSLDGDNDGNISVAEFDAATGAE